MGVFFKWTPGSPFRPEVSRFDTSRLHMSGTLSVDDIHSILTQTVFHPGGCWVFFLYYSLRYFTTRDSGLVIGIWLSAAFAVAVEGWHGLDYLNQRYISRGFRPGKLDPSKDVVVVTGGASGLGQKIVAMLVVKGYKVAILDIRQWSLPVDNCLFVQCNVSDVNEVNKAYEKVKQKFGPATVLVNNAGIAVKKAIWDLTSSDISTTIETNLLSNFWTLKAILPDMIKHNRGYIVTVSSLIGQFGPAGLSSYSASKAGQIMLHDAVKHEVKDYNIGALLVTPSQMSGEMFGDTPTASEFFAPVISHNTMALAIVDAMESCRGGTLSLPLAAKHLHRLRVFPEGVSEFFRRLVRADEAILITHPRTSQGH
uniref:ARAD1D26466p n=1 Tax=Blastobotrys adeninivorans TaxID=409370 RepID=A0A060TGW6_BLAAD